jgi:hypothetical protein
LKQGWELWAGPATGNGSDGRPLFLQALAKYENQEPSLTGTVEIAYISAKDLAELAEKVGERIKESWKSSGPLVVGPKGDVFYQVMNRLS